LGRCDRLRMAAARSRRDSGRAEPEEPRDSSFGPSSLMTATDKQTVTDVQSDGTSAAVGLGHVLDHVKRPQEVALPHVVEFRGVTKTYNADRPSEFTAIRDVNFV